MTPLRQPMLQSMAQQQGDGERAARFTTRAALWERYFGNERGAKQTVTTALGPARNREPIRSGHWVSPACDTRLAQCLASALESEIPGECPRFCVNAVPLVSA